MSPACWYRYHPSGPPVGADWFDSKPALTSAMARPAGGFPGWLLAGAAAVTGVAGCPAVFSDGGLAQAAAANASGEESRAVDDRPRGARYRVNRRR